MTYGNSRSASVCATGCAVTSAAERPSVDLAIPRHGRRVACRALAFSSIASASTVVSATPRRRASASSVSSDERLAVTVVRLAAVDADESFMMRDSSISDFPPGRAPKRRCHFQHPIP